MEIFIYFMLINVLIIEYSDFEIVLGSVFIVAGVSRDQANVDSLGSILCFARIGGRCH